jgi:hypothetical protein
MYHKLKNLLRQSRIPRESISAVHDDDLNSFLTSIGAIHDIEEGKISCKFCGDKIDFGNIQAVLPDSGNISFICNKPSCVHDLIAYQERG